MSVDAIFCGDLHLRETTPRGRIDDYRSAQLAKLKWLSNLQRKYRCPIFCSGDLLHSWRISTGFLCQLIENLPSNLYTCLGNHDLPAHSIKRRYESGIAPLAISGYLKCDMFDLYRDLRFDILQTGFTCTFSSWGRPPSEEDRSDLLVIHEFVYKGRLPWPGCTAGNDRAFLSKYRNFRTILSGDNHQTFVTKTSDGRLLVNPGSFMRMTIDQKDFQPSVFLWDKSENDVERVYVPIEKDVFTHVSDTIDKLEVSDNLRQFVDSLSGCNLGVSFDENLKRFLSSNVVDATIKRYLIDWTE